jgi:hypothetical protein
MRGDVEEAVLEMYLFGDLAQKDSRRRNRRTTEQGEDRPRMQCKPNRLWSRRAPKRLARERSLWRRSNILISNPRRYYLPDEAQMGRERHEHMALLACVGVDEEGFWGGIGHRGGGCRLSEKGAAYYA